MMVLFRVVFFQETFCPVGFLPGGENPGGFFPGGFCWVAFIREAKSTKIQKQVYNIVERST